MPEQGDIVLIPIPFSFSPIRTAVTATTTSSPTASPLNHWISIETWTFWHRCAAG